MWPLDTSTLRDMIKPSAVLCKPTLVEKCDCYPRDTLYIMGKSDDWKSFQRDGEESLSNYSGRKSLSVRLFRLVSDHRHDISSTNSHQQAVCGPFGVSMKHLTSSFGYVGHVRGAWLYPPEHSGSVFHASRGRQWMMFCFMTYEFLHLANFERLW